MTSKKKHVRFQLNNDAEAAGDQTASEASTRPTEPRTKATKTTAATRETKLVYLYKYWQRDFVLIEEYSHCATTEELEQVATVLMDVVRGDREDTYWLNRKVPVDGLQEALDKLRHMHQALLQKRGVTVDEAMQDRLKWIYRQQDPVVMECTRL